MLHRYLLYLIGSLSGFGISLSLVFLIHFAFLIIALPMMGFTLVSLMLLDSYYQSKAKAVPDGAEYLINEVENNQ